MAQGRSHSESCKHLRLCLSASANHAQSSGLTRRHTINGNAAQCPSAGYAQMAAKDDTLQLPTFSAKYHSELTSVLMSVNVVQVVSSESNCIFSPGST
eukprot:CAMPEP_0197697438 /NCGR_PEP_ID=MMETSP1338-20131121/117985_1 /TAXON_ID=43686 ORGANISM="Pelagodinium beii, Strain RCC1491" /NCGR_SAMPLE_ID=MMETSP1338 /ASSEMBLY_ACC=CAM_ASM_000754 /LENGTH=97 /DNA_ID=CAMNT_0043280693 /DNA_START=654 /DNA_END=944 /DNA_ORIENTATION=+